MISRLEVFSLNVSAAKGTVKRPVPEVAVDALGMVGDAHAGPWHRQVSLLAQESIDLVAGQLGRSIGPGEFGENITFLGMPPQAVSPLDRFLFGDVELEVTQIGKECHGSGCAIFQQVGKCLMPAEGLFARVLRGGTIRRGDAGEYRPRPFRCLIVTLSDRAAAGTYSDCSGPPGPGNPGRLLCPVTLALRRGPSHPPGLRGQTARRDRSCPERRCRCDHHDGRNRRRSADITPETIVPMCDKLIPGIVEHLRGKFGRDNPRARLSRAVAGVMGTTQVYAIPGSVRAVEEYLPEILATLEHLVYVLHGLDAH